MRGTALHGGTALFILLPTTLPDLAATPPKGTLGAAIHQQQSGSKRYGSSTPELNVDCIRGVHQ